MRQVAHPGRAAIGVVAGAALWTWLSSPPGWFAFGENALLRAALLGQVVALVRARALIARLVMPESREQRIALVTIVVAALAVRFAVEALPWHALNWLESLACRTDPEPEPAWYANGFGVFMRIPLLLGLDAERAIFTGNRIAGALCCLALYSVDRAFFGDTGKALVSALLLAFLPLHVRLSSSETMQVVPALFALVAVFGFTLHARAGSRDGLVAGVLGLLYAALTRPEAALVAPVLPLLYFGRERWRRLGDPALVALVVPAALVGARLLLLGTPAGRLESAPGHTAAVHLVAPARALANAIEGMSSTGWPMPQLAILSYAGLALLLLRGRLREVLLVVVLLGEQVELAGFETNVVNRPQLLLQQWPWLLLGASGLYAAVRDLAAWVRIPSWARGAALSVLVAWGLAASRSSPIYARNFDEQDEFRFLRSQRPLLTHLKPNLPLAIPTRSSEGPLAVFPSYLVPPNTRLLSLGELLDGAAPLPVVYYRGLSCWSRDTPEFRPGDNAPMQPNCEAVERAFRMEPIATARIDSPPYVGHFAPGHPPIEIGFYRVVARR